MTVLEYQPLALKECVKLTVISFHFKFNGNIWNRRQHWLEFILELEFTGSHLTKRRSCCTVKRHWKYCGNTWHENFFDESLQSEPTFLPVSSHTSDLNCSVNNIWTYRLDRKRQQFISGNVSQCCISAWGVNISSPPLHIHLKKSIILLTNGRSSALGGWHRLFDTLISELLNSDQKLFRSGGGNTGVPAN